MEWKKSNISQSELEKQQQAYIKEALEMAKKSMASQFEKTAEIEKAENERKAAEKAEAERIAAEKAEAERIAAERAEAERIAAEKAKAEKIAAERAEAERIAAERAEAERIAAEKAKAERIAAERAEAERIAAEKIKEELTVYHNSEENDNNEVQDISKGSCQMSDDKKICCEENSIKLNEEDIIDISEIKKSSERQQSQQHQNQSQSPNQTQRQNVNPPNFNRYINDHNKNQCNCPNCRRKRAEQQH